MIQKITFYLIICACILLKQKTHAQTYVIPDANFKNYLAENIPSVLNSTKDLIISNAKNYTGTINCSGLNIEDLSGLQFFNKLTLLNCSNNQLSALPSLDSLKKMQYLWVYNNKLSSIPNVNQLVNLQTLNVKNNLLTNIPSLTGMTALKSFDCSTNKLTVLPDLNTLTNLQEFYCYNNSISILPSISNLTNLKIFNVENNTITQLPDISKNSKIEILQFDLNQIQFIPSLNTLTVLKELIFSNNKISVLPDLSANTNLYLIMGSNNQLTKLPDLSGFLNLTNVELQNNQLSFEDIIPSSNHPQYTTVFHIQPQDSLNSTQVISAIKGSTVTLQLNFDMNVIGSTYNWYKNNVYITSTSIPSLTLTNILDTNQGTYTCTVTNSSFKFVGTTLYARACTIIIKPCITVSGIDYEITNNDCIKGAEIKINDSQINAPNLPLTYTLIPLNNQPVVSSKSLILNDVSSGRYSLTISDINNCSIKLQNYIFVPVPTGCMDSFTPNGDGIEDTYFLDKSGTAKIYTKNGTLVRILNTPSGWDGSDDSGKLCPMGYYIIIINGQEKTGVVLVN